MRSTLPPDGHNGAEAANEPSLADKLRELEEEHRNLDTRIAAMYEFPYRDQLEMQRLKKKKLKLKDIIERLKDDLIPDLNA